MSDTSLLPSSTKAGKKFLDDSPIPYMMFKEVSITKFQNIEYTFYYQSLIKAIKSLLMIDSINQSLVLQYEDKKE
ncbi:12929_t:CDS:1, partial [Ambispora leptoticha]